MRPIRWIVVGAVGLLGVLWVGSSVGASSLPLTQRVLKGGQFAGMKPSSPPTVIRSAAAFAQRDTTLAPRLPQLGFVAAVAEELITPGNPNRYGLGMVVQLSSAANAKAALKTQYASNGPWTMFTVTGIPGAVGFEQVAPPQGGRNIGFALGPYFYLVGAGWQNGAKNAIPRSALQVAALLIYNRVR